MRRPHCQLFPINLGVMADVNGKALAKQNNVNTSGLYILGCQLQEFLLDITEIHAIILTRLDADDGFLVGRFTDTDQGASYHIRMIVENSLTWNCVKRS